jgi:hypothetical protein
MCKADILETDNSWSLLCHFWSWSWRLDDGLGTACDLVDVLPARFDSSSKPHNRSEHK